MNLVRRECRGCSRSCYGYQRAHRSITTDSRLLALQSHQHVIAERPDSRATSQPRIKMLTELEEVRMPPGPGFKVTGGHSDSNALHRLHLKFGSKRSEQEISRKDNGHG